MTMDQLYDDCATVLTELNPAQGKFAFSFDAQGALKECTYTWHQCDGGLCILGDTITGFACGPLDPRPR